MKILNQEKNVYFFYVLSSFGSTPDMFRSSMVNPSPEYLQASWRY